MIFPWFSYGSSDGLYLASDIAEELWGVLLHLATHHGFSLGSPGGYPVIPIFCEQNVNGLTSGNILTGKHRFTHEDHGIFLCFFP